WILARVR
ncbi:hypothetical protein D046_6756B, partial [Vibrio parahaemolyticus V-223/04]